MRHPDHSPARSTRRSWPHAAVVLSAAAVGASAGCRTERTAPDGPESPVALTVVSGSGQTGTVGARLEAPVVVRALDARGRPVSGLAVTFRVTGGGSVFTDVANTSSEGLASTFWTLATTPAGPQRLEARATDPTPSLPPLVATFGAVAVAAAPARFTTVAGTDSARVGTALQVAPGVRVADGYGNPVVGLRVTFTASTGAPDLGGARTAVTPTDSLGVARPAVWTLGSIAGASEVVATIAGRSEPIAVLTSRAIPEPSTPRLVLVGGGGQSVTVEDRPALPIVIGVRDRFGNPVGSTIVVDGDGFEQIGIVGGATCSTRPCTLTVRDGAAQLTFRALGAAGRRELRVRLADDSSASLVVPVQFLTGLACRLTVLRGHLQSAPAGTDVAIPPAVRVTDAAGNPVAGVSVQFESVDRRFIVGVEGGVMTPRTVVSDADGVAAVTRWTLGPTRGENRGWAFMPMCRPSTISPGAPTWVPIYATGT